MKKIIMFASVCFFSAVTVAAVQPEDTSKGIVTYSAGRVRKQPRNFNMWQSAPRNTEIFSGDKVRASTRSRAELDLAQLDIKSLSPQTTIDILKLY